MYSIAEREGRYSTFCRTENKGDTFRFSQRQKTDKSCLFKADREGDILGCSGHREKGDTS